MSATMDKTMTRKAFLDFVGVTDRHLRRLVSEKKVRPAIKRGHKVLFFVEDALRLAPMSRFDVERVLAFAVAVYRL